MERQSFQSVVLPPPSVLLGVSVGAIHQNRHREAFDVASNLMPATCDGSGQNECASGIFGSRQTFDIGLCFLCSALSSQWHIEKCGRLGLCPASCAEQIGLLGGSRLHCGLNHGGCGLVFGEHQTARGRSIEPMHSVHTAPHLISNQLKESDFVAHHFLSLIHI